MADVPNAAINDILQRMMTTRDMDSRYTATLDLLNKINNGEIVSNHDLRIVLSEIVIRLFDEIDMISGFALKCLSPLVKLVQDQELLKMIAELLCNRLVYGWVHHRDINKACIALKTIFCEVPASSAVNILATISPDMIIGITSPVTGTDDDIDIKCACLDILCDALRTCGNRLASLDRLLNDLLPQLSFNHSIVRKKAVSCIASLATSLSDNLLAKAAGEVVGRLRSSVKPEMARTNIQMLGALSRAVGYRFGKYLPDTIPEIIGYCMNTSENNEELGACSLEALESFLLMCTKDISSYCDEILRLSLKFLSYDPNFDDIMEEDTDDETHEEDEGCESDNEYLDDVDDSWKVRRAAAKCLTALIISRPEMLSKLFVEACPELIKRFRERDENVKMDVFNTFIELLRQTRNASNWLNEAHESSPKWFLKQEVPKIVNSVKRQLKVISVKTKVGAFSILKELAVVFPDGVADNFGSLIPEIKNALYDKSSTSTLKIEALMLTRLVLASNSPTGLHPYIETISGAALLAVGESYYKVTAEALRVCQEIVCVICPETEGYNFDFKPYVYPIYNAIMENLKNQDQDKEVKECAISCMGLVVSRFGDNLRTELPACLPIFADRMGNDITRLAAVKAFAVVAASPLHLDLSCVLENVIAELTEFLRKGNQALKEATLGALNTLVVGYGDKIGSTAYEVIIAELSCLIRDSDLHLSALTLNLCSTLMADRKPASNVAFTVRNKVLPQAITLVKSSLLHEQALSALQSFFANMVYSSHTSFDDILGGLRLTFEPSSLSDYIVAKQALFSIAKCVAVLCLAAGDQKCSSTVKMLASMLKANSFTSVGKQHLSLECLGEIGCRKDLSSHAHIENIVTEYFQSPFEDIKLAASYALGKIAVGNLASYLPFLLDQFDKQQRKQYLLLYSLKEVLVRQSAHKTDFQDSSVKKILNLLFNHCENEEEDIRNVVAECLGKIALIKPGEVVPALKWGLKIPAAFTRATVVTAVKYSLVEGPEIIDEIIYPEISTFLISIRDQDWHVRRAAVLALNTAAQNKPKFLKGCLPELLPFLYDQTMIKKELTRKVDLGPFKHTVDDGLELRKAAFECIGTLLDGFLHQMSPSSFIVPYLTSGLDDIYDVKLLCHLILSKLADKCPSAVLSVLDLVVGPLQKTVEYSPKQDTEKQEMDRNEDMIRSALRAISSLNCTRIHCHGENYCPSFRRLMDKISQSPTLWEKFSSIRNE